MRMMYFCGGNNLGEVSCNLFDTFDVDAVSSQDTALVIPGDENDESFHVNALVSNLTISPSLYFDQGEELMTDHQYSAMTSPNFVVLEQPAKKYFVSDPNTSHAGTQCALGIDGSDESEKAEAEAAGGQYDTLMAKKCSTEELTRKERRREQNRRAAARCRTRRKMREAAIEMEMEKEMMTMRCLETEVQRLTSHKQQLEMTLVQHGVYVPRADHSLSQGDATSPSSGFLTSVPGLYTPDPGAFA